MDRARDLFCFMCFTGLKFTELQRLQKEDVTGEEVVVRREGGKERRVHLNRFAREILVPYENRYYLNNSAFPSMSIITMNKYLREIGKQLGFDLHEKLTAGIAVNTFIANALKLDIPAEIISGFTGVKQDSRINRIKMELSKREIQKFDGK
jgi:integrase